METKTHSFSYDYYNSQQELPEELRSLMEQAHQIRQQAYMPYSKFAVGVALLLDNGQVITGNNQENAAFPSGLCAERVAIFYAMAQYPNAKVLKMAITGSDIFTPRKIPVAPCGACRQSILEYETNREQAIEIATMGAEGGVIVTQSVRHLLPFSFTSLVE